MPGGQFLDPPWWTMAEQLGGSAFSGTNSVVRTLPGRLGQLCAKRIASVIRESGLKPRK
jgi:hypothetical protein